MSELNDVKDTAVGDNSNTNNGTSDGTCNVVELFNIGKYHGKEKGPELEAFMLFSGRQTEMSEKARLANASLFR